MPWQIVLPVSASSSSSWKGRFLNTLHPIYALYGIWTGSSREIRARGVYITKLDHVARRDFVTSNCSLLSTRSRRMHLQQPHRRSSLPPPKDPAADRHLHLVWLASPIPHPPCHMPLHPPVAHLEWLNRYKCISVERCVCVACNAPEKHFAGASPPAISHCRLCLHLNIFRFIAMRLPQLSCPAPHPRQDCRHSSLRFFVKCN